MPLKTTFGKWTLNKASLTLDFTGGIAYQIPLDDMTDPAKILDWIYQIEEKTWASTEVIGELVEALAYYFGRSVCGGGMASSIDAKGIIQQRIKTDA